MKKAKTENQTGRFSKVRTDHAVVAALMILVFIVRMILAETLPNIVYPDEVFQSVEQAHRLIFGYGTIPWEFDPKYGLRNWVFPGALTVVMSFANFIAPDSLLYIQFNRAFMGLISIAPNIVLYKLLRKKTTHLVPIIASLVLFNFWIEMMYFSTKTLSGVVGSSFLLLGLGYAQLTLTESNKRNSLYAAVFLTAASFFRIQIAPACFLGYLFVFINSKSWAERRALIYAGLAVASFFGAVDWITWGSPFHSYFANLHLNIGKGVAASFGTSPWHTYLRYISLSWGVATVFILGLAAYDARKNTLLLGCALTVIASMSMIGHKEFRFIFPAISIIIFLSALNLTELYRKKSVDKLKFCAFFAVLMGLNIFQSTKYHPWHLKKERLDMYATLRQQEDLCGLSLHGATIVGFPGYYYLHKNIPIRSTFKEPNPLEKDISNEPTNDTNYHIFHKDIKLEEKFENVKCGKETCLYKTGNRCS